MDRSPDPSKRRNWSPSRETSPSISTGSPPGRESGRPSGPPSAATSSRTGSAPARRCRRRADHERRRRAAGDAAHRAVLVGLALRRLHHAEPALRVDDLAAQPVPAEPEPAPEAPGSGAVTAAPEPRGLGRHLDELPAIALDAVSAQATSRRPRARSCASGPCLPSPDERHKSASKGGIRRTGACATVHSPGTGGGLQASAELRLGVPGELPLPERPLGAGERARHGRQTRRARRPRPRARSAQFPAGTGK